MNKDQILDIIEQKRQEYAADDKKHFDAAFKEKPGSPAFQEEFLKHMEAQAAARALGQIWFDVASMI